jgi:dienelactone hydrolase
MDAGPSPLTTYRALSDAVFALYAEGRQREALDLLDGPGPDLEPWRAELAHLEACLHGSLGDRDAALASLVGAHAAGAWWDPSVLVEDDDLASLGGVPAFTSLVESSRERWERANAVPDRGGDRLALPSRTARGLVVALHGAEEDADDAMTAWGGAVDLGFVVLAVRSSQRTSPAYRSWPDQDRAVAEVADALAALPAATRALPVVAGGFSAGGRVALRWALSGAPCPAAGVVAVAPAWSGRVDGDRPEGLDPAVLVVGTDDDLHDDVAAAAADLAPVGFELHSVPGLGHRFPDDFTARLAALLDAIG